MQASDLAPGPVLQALFFSDSYRLLKAEASGVYGCSAPLKSRLQVTGLGFQAALSPLAHTPLDSGRSGVNSAEHLMQSAQNVLPVVPGHPVVLEIQEVQPHQSSPGIQPAL